ncbi:MAG: NAD(P)-binding domain-containing protein [Verrucomicrobia bacterium]|nr:NAD(P)-binding domain-containing protein [Verrucomicrobiota bacterium]
MKLSHQVLIIGAGPAGVGCALALQAAGVEDVLVVDHKGVGASFEAWPEQMRLLTPSFHSNAFGFADLNSISPETSPADFLNTQHPSGKAYASYLRATAMHYELAVETGVRVTGLRRVRDSFEVQTSQGIKTARFVVWAIGEFSRPDHGGIEGAEFCLHNSQVRDWDQLVVGNQKFTLIGGYESGIDAAINLMHLGKEAHLLSRGHPWESDDPDPSRALSPHTRDRLKTALIEAPGTIHFYKNAEVLAVRPVRGGYELEVRDGKPFHSPTQPILCTGFRSALEPIRELWAWEDDHPVFTEEADESTHTPGLFYSGPSLQHRGMLFCFIYKYRARFGIIAREIAMRLGIETGGGLDLWKRRGFLLEDLSCCTDCQCAVSADEEKAPIQTAEVIEYAQAA